MSTRTHVLKPAPPPDYISFIETWSPEDVATAQRFVLRLPERDDLRRFVLVAVRFRELQLGIVDTLEQAEEGTA